MRAAALAGRHATDDEYEDDGDLDVPRLPAWHAPPAEATASSAEATAVIDAVFADFDAPAASDERLDMLLTTGQAAALLGISRPTLVAWLQAGRIPFQWRGSHRRLRTSDVRTYLDGRSTMSDSVEGRRPRVLLTAGAGGRTSMSAGSWCRSLRCEAESESSRPGPWRSVARAAPRWSRPALWPYEAVYPFRHLAGPAVTREAHVHCCSRGQHVPFAVRELSRQPQ